MLNSSCDSPISSWLVVGPFPLDTGVLRLDHLDVGEPAVLFASAGDTVPGARAKRWRAILSDSLGRVDLYSVLPEPSLDDRAAYALTYITSPEARTVRLAVESDDDVVIWLNGRRVHRHDIGRELRSSADTISLALAPGANRLLYKVVNRGGGFGLGGRLLSASRDPIGDLRIDASAASRELAKRVSPGDTARGPAARSPVTLGPVTMASRAQLQPPEGARAAAHVANTRLVAPLRICATRWSGETEPISLTIGTASALLPPSRIGQPVVVGLDADWADLARGVLGSSAQVVAHRKEKELSQISLPVTADALLSLLSRPVQVERWYGVGNEDAAPNASSHHALRNIERNASADSAIRQRLSSLATEIILPPTLEGLALEAEVAEFGPASVATVNGAVRSPDSLGRVTLCAPCRGGSPLAISISIRGPWWDAPLLRVRDLGWSEIRDGAQWARYLTRDSSFVTPDSAVARQLLRSALDSSKTAYHASIAQWLERLDPAASRVRRDTIDLVGHSHIDAAWTWRWREGVDVVQATWATTAKLMAKYPDMHFAASSAQYYAWLEQRDPALLSRIQTLVRQGRWNPVGGWWVEADANLPSGESLVRQALYGQRTFIRLFGKPARVAWLPNSFGFAWSLPQILRKSGFEFFVTEEMRWNDTNRWPPGLNAFWWEGPDGSRIFTDMIYAYDHDLTPRRLAKEFVETRDSSASRRMLTVYGVGDHGGGPTMAMLDRARDFQRVPTFPVLRDASPDSSLSRMRLDAKDGPVLRDELYLEYHRGTYTTQAAIKRRNRALETLLGAAEAAATVAPLPYPHDSLRTAWERVLFNQFHDILPGTATAEVYDDAAADYAHAESIAARVLRQSLTAIAAEMDTRPPAAGDVPYIIFNPGGRMRTGIVRLPLTTGTVARDESGHVLASAIEGSTLAVRVPAAPALGTALVFVGRKPSTPALAALRNVTANGRHVLESATLRVEVDSATGSIHRLYDKLHHVEVLAPGAAGLVTMVDEPQLWDAWNIDNLKGKRAWIDQAVRIDSVEHSPLGDELTVHRQRDGARVTERYALRDEPARLDIIMSIDWRETHRLLKLAVPLAFHVDSTRAEIPYASIARPTRPATRRDSARFETPMQRWVDASARGFGVAVVNDGKYGYSASGDTMFITLLRSPKWPDPHADMGTQPVLLSIVPHTGDWRAGEIQRAALELNSPLVAVAVTPHAGGAGSSGTPWMSVEPASAELGAVKRAEDDDRAIVRVVETSGRSTRARLSFTVPMEANEVDLLERPVRGGYHSRGRTMDVPLRAFEIKTIAIEPR